MFTFLRPFVVTYDKFGMDVNKIPIALNFLSDLSSNVNFLFPLNGLKKMSSNNDDNDIVMGT